MKSLKPIFAVILLAIFSLASSHTLLESFELIHHDGDHSHAESPVTSNSHDAADGVCRVDVNRTQVQKSFSDLQTELNNFLTLDIGFLQQDLPGRGTEIGRSGSPPLELGPTWQFSSRTALPARAPSIAS